MLMDYDAKAIADVMGIAFVRVSPTRDKTNMSVFTVDQDQIQVVTDDQPSRFVPDSSSFIERAVERGLPRLALRHVAEQLAGGDRAKVSALEWAVVPKTTLERRANLSPQESERTERVARLFVHARRALGSVQEARQFMTTPHPRLDGRSPVAAAMTDLGTRRTEQILNALEYGLAL